VAVEVNSIFVSPCPPAKELCEPAPEGKAKVYNQKWDGGTHRSIVTGRATSPEVCGIGPTLRRRGSLPIKSEASFYTVRPPCSCGNTIGMYQSKCAWETRKVPQTNPLRNSEQDISNSTANGVHDIWFSQEASKLTIFPTVHIRCLSIAIRISKFRNGTVFALF